MLRSNIPTKFSLPFASGATPGTGVRPIPITPPVQPGAASLTTGFGPLNFTPVAAGGIPPFGQDMNGILQQITSWDQWVAAGGPITYDATFAGSISGYPRGALLMSTSGHAVFQNLSDGNQTDPNAGTPTSWVIVYSPWSAKAWQAAGSANAQVITLSPAPTSASQLVGIPINFFSQGTNTGTVTLNVNATGAFPIVQANGIALGASALVTGGSAVVRFTGTAYHLVSQSAVFTDSGTASVILSGVNNSNGANLALFGNGATTPNKYIRARNGVLEIIDSVYQAVIASLTNLGALTITSSLTTGSAITANSGNVTSNVGRLRAGLGARNSGDANAATLNLDFPAQMSGNGYQIFPSAGGSFMLQWGYYTVPCDNLVHSLTYPLAFPLNAPIGVVGTYAIVNPLTGLQTNIANVGPLGAQVINGNGTTFLAQNRSSAADQPSVFFMAIGQ